MQLMGAKDHGRFTGEQIVTPLRSKLDGDRVGGRFGLTQPLCNGVKVAGGMDRTIADLHNMAVVEVLSK